MDSKRSTRPVNREPNADVSPDQQGPGLFGSDAADDSAALETPETSPNGSDGRQANGFASVESDGRSEVPGAPPTDDDPFNPDRLRLSQDFAAAVGVRKVLTTVPVRKPDKSWFVRTHPELAYRLPTLLLRLKEDGEVYLVDPSLADAVATEPTVGPGLLITSMTRQGVLFLWEIPLPGPDGKPNPWHQSALEAAETARTEWVRVTANRALGAYDLTVAPAHHAEPDWPDLPMREILRIAFRDKRISTWDHPVLRRLRGEA